MTKLEVLNYFILQWFFIRLCKVYNNDGDYEGMALMVGVYPLSGWGKPYKKTSWYFFYD